METRALPFSFMSMFDRWTKKATVNAIETTKETLNDKLETYSGIIKVFLTVATIAFGAKKVNDHYSNRGAVQAPHSLPPYQQQPIIINNYIDRGYTSNGRQGQNRKQYQNRR